MPGGEFEGRSDVRAWSMGEAVIAAIARVGEAAEGHARAAEARGDAFWAGLERQRAARADELVRHLEALIDELDC